ncbi:MAG: hypothetical protein R3F28_12840 [Candidatus Kapaibacterium sp.]
MRRALLLMVCMVPITVFAQEGEPRHPAIVHFEEIGRIQASLKELWPLGDVSGDSIADIAIQYSSDTAIEVAGIPAPYHPLETAILLGVKGAIPAIKDTMRFGVRERNTDTYIVAVGDWDGQKGKDICAVIRTYGDTSFGNTDLVYDPISRTIIFWNDGTGHYSVDDTTHLNPGINATFFPSHGLSVDYDKDGIEDLFLLRGGGIKDGKPVGYASFHYFKGVNSSTWHRNDGANSPRWQWWSAPKNIDRLESQDLDHDGVQDIIFYINEANSPLTILYGRNDRGFPDTIIDLQQISINGLASNFSDVTGDNYADLIILNSAQDFVYCYVSTPSARRLQDMFGTGNDPPREGEWWSRPWATLKGPKLVNQFWLGLGSQLFPLGSADTSSPDEIWIYSWPYILIYRTGIRLDSLIDAEIDTRVANGTPVRIGDINGDGRDELAMVGNPIVIFRLPDALPSTVGRARKVPDGTDMPDSVSSVVKTIRPQASSLDLDVRPNPSSGAISIAWKNPVLGTGKAGLFLRITDLLGQDVLSVELPNDQAGYIWDASKTFGGRYFITVTIGDVSQTEQITIQH